MSCFYNKTGKAITEAAANKKPCLYSGRRKFPVFFAPGGINEDANSTSFKRVYI